MNWREELTSANNSRVDIKAVISALAFLIAVGVYLSFAVKGWFVDWDMPPAIRDITISLIAGGVLGAGSTLLNQRLGVSPAPILQREIGVVGSNESSPAEAEHEGPEG